NAVKNRRRRRVRVAGGHQKTADGIRRRFCRWHSLSHAPERLRQEGLGARHPGIADQGLARRFLVSLPKGVPGQGDTHHYEQKKSAEDGEFAHRRTFTILRITKCAATRAMAQITSMFLPVGFSKRMFR